MKRIFTLLIASIFSTLIFAQAPEKVSYQAVLRDGSDNLIINQSVGIKVSVLQGSATGTVVFAETHNTSTNANGLVTVQIGDGSISAGSMATIDWASGPHFIKTEIDPAGGTNYSITQTSELLSVPYALHANTADSVAGGMAETDPIYAADPASGITNSDITNWNNKLSTEVDGSVTNEIQSLSLSNDTLSLSQANSVYLGGGGASLWSLANTSDLFHSAGSVKIGETQNSTLFPAHLTVGDTGSASIMVGHAGNFNEINSGKIVFTEDVNYSAGTCGFEFQLNGSANTLSMVSGCPTLSDTSIVLTRSGDVRIPERMRVGGGAALNPSATLDVVQIGNLSSSNGAKFRAGTSGTDIWNIGTDASGNFGFMYNGTLKGSINSSTGAYATSSDQSLKTNITPITTVLSRVLQLKPARYQYKDSENGDFALGFMAQEVQPLFPEAVTLAGNDKLAVYYSYFGVIAIKAIQEQQEIIENQQQEIDELKSLLQQVETRLSKLEE